jgi:peptidoglycan/xylan/chitin deacetylase (PgdA/CDA1 family)
MISLPPLIDAVGPFFRLGLGMQLASRRGRIGVRLRRVTLTFDNGPTFGVTDRVLQILDRAGIHATFFVIGGKLADSSAAALMRKAYAAGD